MPPKRARKGRKVRKAVRFHPSVYSTVAGDRLNRRRYPISRSGRMLKRAVAGRKIAKFMRKRLGHKPLRAYYMSGAYKRFKY